MIDFYTWQTSNGRKVSIMLEEIGLDYQVIPINLGEGEQFEECYVQLNPNAKIPTIVDHDPVDGPFAVFESGAILMYLADKTGKLFSTDHRRRYDIIQWLMFQMGGVGPMFGQLHHFKRTEEARLDSYGLNRYENEARRLYGVINRRLENHEYLVDDYSIADVATFPWVLRYEWQEINLEEFPHVKRWFDLVMERPAVQTGIAIPKID